MRHTGLTSPMTPAVQKRRPRWSCVCSMLLLLFGMAVTAHGSGGDVTTPPWPVIDGVSGKQNAMASAVDSHGNVIVAGFNEAGTTSSYHTVRFNASGSVAWTAEPVPGQATAVVVDADDNIIVTGFASNGVNNDIVTVKYCNSAEAEKCNGTPVGRIMWQHTVDGAAHGHDVGTAVAVDGNNVYVAGYSQNALGNNDYVILKYDPLPETATTGKLLWQRAYSGSANNADQAVAIAATSKGIAVTGYSSNATVNGTTITDIETLKFDAAGNQTWAKRYSATGSSTGQYVRLDGNGNVIVAGSATNSGATDIYLVKYGSGDGAILWEKAPDTTPGLMTTPYGLTLDTADDVYVVGATVTISGSHDIVTAKYKGTSDNGTIAAPAWPKVRVYNSYDGNDDVAAAIAVAADGVYVTGYTAAAEHSTIQTLKYTLDSGVLLWHKDVAIYDGKDARPVGIHISRESGEVLVGGWSDSASNDYDYFALTYDQGLLNAPTSLAAAATSQTSVAVTWQDNSGDESGFELKRCTDEAMTSSCSIFTVGSHTGSSGTVTYPDTGLAENTSYFYQARAFRNGTPNLYSNPSDVAEGLTVFVSPAAPQWSYIYNGPGGVDDYAVAIAVGSDNNPVATGTRTSTGPDYDYHTVKLARTDKSVLWSVRYDGEISMDDEATCLAIDSTDSVIVSGNASLYNGVTGAVSSINTLRYSAAGAGAALHDQYNGPVTGGAVSDRAVANAVDASRNVVVVGHGLNAAGAAGNNDIYLIKYNADGSRAWTATPFDGTAHGHDQPTALALAGDGSIFISGYTGKAAPYYGTSNFFAAKYNGATGDRIWTYEYSLTPSGDNKASSLAIDGHGDPYVTGYVTNATGNKDIYTVKFDGASNSSVPVIKWAKAHGGSFHGDDQGVAIKIDRVNDADPVSGNVVVAGTTLSGTGDNDVILIRYDAAGNTNWVSVLKRPEFDDHAKALGLDSQGKLFVAANSSNGTATHSVTLKFDYLGKYLSATSYTTDPNSVVTDEAMGIAVNTFDEAFVAGSRNNPAADKDFLVYKVAAETSPALMPYSFAAAPSHASVVLNWQDNTASRSGYKIERQQGACSFESNSGTWTAVGTPGATATTYTDGGLATGATYCYRIQTTQSSGGKSRWNYLAATTPLLEAPTNLQCAATNNTTDVYCTWNDTTSGKTGFHLYRCNAQGAECTDSLLPAGHTQLQYTDTSACPSSTYTYKVSTYGLGWETSQVSASSAAGTSPIPATPPVLIAATRVSEVTIQVNWSYTSADETGFRIDRCSYDPATESTCTLSPHPTRPTVDRNTTSFTDTGLTPKTRYRYQVRAYKNATCNGGWNGPVSTPFKEATTDLLAPGNLITTPVDTNSIKVDWTVNTASETGFSLERSTGPCPFTTIDAGFPVALGHGVATYTDTTAAAATAAEGVATYCYRVKATGTPTPPWPSDYSNAQSGSPKPVIPPSKPVASPQSEARIDISWNYSPAASSDMTGQELYRCAGASCSPTFLATLTVGQRSYSDTAVVSGETYYYQVRAIKTGKWSKQSPPSDPVSPLPITAPALLTPTAVDTNTIRLDWTESLTSETGFSLERSTGPCPFTTVDTGFPVTVGKDVHTYTDATASGATAAEGIAKYCYRVKANGTPTPPWPSGYSNAQTGSPTPIVLPSMTQASPVSEVKITVTWARSTNSDATGQQIYRCTTAESPCTTLLATVPAILPATQTSYDDATASTGTTYYYQVHAIKTGKWEKASLNTVNSAPAAITAPVLLTPTPVDTTTIRLDWTENLATETGFSLERSTGACPFTTNDAGFPVSLGKDVHTYSDGTASAATAAEGIARYCYRIKATGTPTPPWPSGYSTSQTGSPAPVVLPSMTLATPVSEAKITVSWAKSTNPDVTGQQLYRCTTAASPCTTLLATVPAILPATQTAYDDTTVSTGTTYYYQVHAIKTGKWNKSTLNSVNTAPLLSGPTDMACTTATANTTQVTCSWKDTTTSETGFTLERCNGAACPDTPQTMALYTLNGSLDDTSGRGLNLTGSTPTYEDGGLRLSSGSSYQTVSSDMLDNDSHTIEFDIKIVNSSTTNKKILTYSPATDRSPGIWLGGTDAYGANKLLWRYNSPNSGPSFGADAGTALFAVNTWYHIKAVKNGPSLKIYVNNSTTPASDTVVSSPKEPGTAPLILGDFPGHPSADVILKNLSITNNFKVSTYVPSTSVATIGTTVTYADTTPLNGTQYTYKVRAANTTAPWNSGYSGVSTVTTPAAVTPSLVSVVNSPEASDQIKVTWTASNTDISGYKVERCQGNEADCPATDTTGKFTQAGADLPPGTLSFSDSTLLLNTPYIYRVKAFKSTGSNSWTKTSTAAGATATPLAPALTAKTFNATQIDLAWTDTTGGETNFEVQRCLGAGCTNFGRVALVPANTPKYADMAVLPSTRYVYQVRAINEGLSYNGGSAWTKKAKVPITDFVPEYQTKMVVELTDVSGMKSDFSDMRFYDADTKLELPYWIESQTASSATVWFKTGKTNNAYLYYGNPQASSASNIANSFLFSEDFSGDGSKWDLGGAQVPVMTVENGQARLTGTPPACHQTCSYDEYGTEYCYEACDGISYFAATKEAFSMSTGLKVEYDLQINTGTNSYYVWQGLAGAAASIVQRFDAAVCNPYDSYDCNYVHGVTVYTSEQSVTGAGATRPADASLHHATLTITPGGATAVFNGDSANVNAAIPAGSQFKLKFNVGSSLNGITIDNIRIRKYSTVEPKAGKPQTPESVTSFTTTWSTPFSGTASDETPALPVPGDLECSADNTTQVTCHWDDTTSGETGFTIQRCQVALDGSCNFAPLITTGANVETYIDTTASHSTSYKYRVFATRAIEPQWNSGYSNEDGATTGIAAAPAPFEATPVSISEIALKWTNKTTDETGYKVERCTPVAQAVTCSNFAELPGGLLAPHSASFSNTGLPASTLYCYRVRVFKTATPGGWDLPSSPYCERTSPVKPNEFEAKALNSFTVELKWKDPSPEATGFIVEKQTWNEKWVEIATVPADKLLFLDTLGNEPQKKYTYRIKTFRGPGQSEYSQASATTPAFTQNDTTCK